MINFLYAFLLWGVIYVIFSFIEDFLSNDSEDINKYKDVNTIVNENPSLLVIKEKLLKNYMENKRRIVLQKKANGFQVYVHKVTHVSMDLADKPLSLLNIKKNICKILNYDHTLIEMCYDENNKNEVITYYENKKNKFFYRKSSRQSKGTIIIYNRNGDIICHCHTTYGYSLILIEYDKNNSPIFKKGYLCKDILFEDNYVNLNYHVPMDLLLLYLALNIDDLDDFINKNNYNI